MNLLSGDPPRGRALQILIAAIVVLLALAPFLFPGAKALNVAAKTCVMILLAASYDVLLGYAGIVSFAHVMFFGVGAYGVGLALYRLGASWAALAAGLVIAFALSLALALAIGLFSLRVQSIFFAMVTLAVAYAFNVLASQLSWLTGGEDGRSFKVPPALQPGFKWLDHPIFGVQANGKLLTYYLVFAVVLVAFLVLLRVVNSPFGRVLQAIRENPFRAEALGYRTVFHRTLATCISALGATLAGALSALWLRYVGPDTALSFSIQVDVLVMVVVGGMGSLYGAIIGAALFVLAESYLQDAMGALSHLAADAHLPLLPALSIPTAGSYGSASPSCWRCISLRRALSGRFGQRTRSRVSFQRRFTGVSQSSWRTFGSASGRSSEMRPRPSERAAGAMQPDGGRGRLERRDPLRGEAGDEAGQHVAGAGGSQRRRQVPADRGPAVRRGHDRIGALEDDDRAREPGRRPRPPELVVPGLDARSAGEEPRELALVRRHDDRMAAALDQRRQLPGFAGEAGQRVRVEHDRSPFAGRVSAAATSLRRSGPTPAPGPSAIARRRSSASSASKPRAPE